MDFADLAFHNEFSRKDPPEWVQPKRPSRMGSAEKTLHNGFSRIVSPVCASQNESQSAR